MPEPRYARAAAPLYQVLPHLPQNYFARDNVDHTLIFGADDAEHTLDAHVLPRLARAHIDITAVGHAIP